MSQKIHDLTDVSSLSYVETRMQLRADGMNKLSAAKCRDITAIALKVVREPMFLLELVVGGALFFFLLTLRLPFLREIFYFAPVTPCQLALSFPASLCSVLWLELFKLIRRY
jgi:hypothetical protein